MRKTCPCKDCGKMMEDVPNGTVRCSDCKPMHTKRYDEDYKLNNPNNYRWHVIKRKSKVRGIGFKMTEDECSKIWSQPCTYCGTTDLGKTFGMDRIDNSIGYKESNVLPCCGSCNKIRGESLTVEEMRVAMNAVLNLRRK